LPIKKRSAGTFHLAFVAVATTDVVRESLTFCRRISRDPDSSVHARSGVPPTFYGIGRDLLFSLDRSRRHGVAISSRLDRTGAEPPATPAEAACEDHYQHPVHDGERFYQRDPSNPSACCAEMTAEPMEWEFEPDNSRRGTIGMPPSSWSLSQAASSPCEGSTQATRDQHQPCAKRIPCIAPLGAGVDI